MAWGEPEEKKRRPDDVGPGVGNPWRRRIERRGVVCGAARGGMWSGAVWPDGAGRGEEAAVCGAARSVCGAAGWRPMVWGPGYVQGNREERRVTGAQTPNIDAGHTGVGSSTYLLLQLLLDLPTAVNFKPPRCSHDFRRN